MRQIINEPKGEINSETKIDWFNIPNANCGVVGCWGKDSQGRTTLNGQVFQGNTSNAQIELKRYKLKDDFVNGVLPNANGFLPNANGFLPNANSKPNILFKKGDIIQGIQIDKFIFNTNTKGIMAKPTVSTARVETSDGLVFVPLQVLEIKTDLIDNIGVESKNMTAEDKLYEKLGIKFNISGSGIKSRPMGRILLLLVSVGGYMIYKKINK